MLVDNIAQEHWSALDVRKNENGPRRVQMNPVLVAQILDPKQNNFNLLRLLAAAAVVISHAVFLRSGSKADEIFSGINYYAQPAMAE